jgi:hypothetical protein
MSEWLTFQEAVEIVKAQLGGAIGRAEFMVRAARTSGEVRFSNSADPVLLMADDGLVGMDMRPGAQEKGGIARDGKRVVHTLSTAPTGDCISKEDLLDWLGRQYPSTIEQSAMASARYPGDAALIEEGRRMRAGGMQKRAVARALAGRAEGPGTVESKVDRLRKLL